MLGASKASFEAARDTIAGKAAAPGFDTLGDELLAVSTVLAGSTALRGSLADPGSAAHERQALASTVFAGRIGGLALEVVLDTVARRWTGPRDLVDAVEGLGIEAHLVSAEQADRLDRVEDELFRVGRIIGGDNDLRTTLTDESVDLGLRRSLIVELLQGKAAPETIVLVGHIVAQPRGRRLERALDELVEQAARRRQRLLATVRVAAPLTLEQDQRLSAALSRLYRREIDLQVEVDPSVIGGAVVTVGEEVIDGSVAHRLEEIRRSMGV